MTIKMTSLTEMAEQEIANLGDSCFFEETEPETLEEIRQLIIEFREQYKSTEDNPLRFSNEWTLEPYLLKSASLRALLRFCLECKESEFQFGMSTLLRIHIYPLTFCLEMIKGDEANVRLVILNMNEIWSRPHDREHLGFNVTEEDVQRLAEGKSSDFEKIIPLSDIKAEIQAVLQFWKPDVERQSRSINCAIKQIDSILSI